MVEEGPLYRVQDVSVRQPLDGQDLGPVEARREGKTGIDPAPVDDHRAGAALTAITALLGTGESEALTQEIEKRDARVVEDDVLRLPVQREPDRYRHARFRLPKLENPLR